MKTERLLHSYGVRKRRHHPVLVTYRSPALRPPVALTLVAFIALLLFNGLHPEPAASASLAGQKEDKLKDPKFIADRREQPGTLCDELRVFQLEIGALRRT